MRKIGTGTDGQADDRNVIPMFLPAYACDTKTTVRTSNWILRKSP